VMQALPVGVAITDAQGGILQCNSAFDQVWGEPRPSAQTVSDYAAYRAWWGDTGTALAPAEWASARAIQQGEAVIGQLLEIQRFDGSRAFVINSAAPVRAAGGKVVGSAVTIQDITVLRKAEQALRDSEARFRATAKAIEGQWAFLRQVIDLDRNFIFAKDRQGRFVLVNQAVADAYGTTVEDLTGKTDADFNLDLDEVDHFRRDDLEVMDTLQEKIILEEPITDAADRIRWLQTVKRPIVSPDGKIDMVLGVATDITERKQAEQALIKEKERAQVTLHSIGDAVVTTDAHGLVEYLNPVAEKLTAWSADEARGRPLSTVFQIVSEETRQPAPDPVAHCLTEGPITGLADYTILLSRTGQEYAIQYSAAPIRGPGGELFGAVLVFSDVTEARRLTKQIAHEAAHDTLTGLANRREFEKRLERALASAKQYGAHHALCYLDLDQFKIINDTAGHVAGDELLKQVKDLLLGAFRERDTFARLGGDEFGLLLDNCPLEKAREIADHVVAIIRDYRFAWLGRTFQIGVSIGLVPITTAAESTDQLLGQADVACYIAKERGRNRLHIYQQDNSESAERHTEILRAAGLRDALEQERFCLYYQPIIPLAANGDGPVRYELLLRLRDENGALLKPGAFIPAAERYSLMGAIDRWVIRTAFYRYMERLAGSATEIAINLSGNSLNDETLLEFVKAQFVESGLPPERVCFEVTETVAIYNLSQARDFMKGIKRYGCHWALDDFGSGLSSFKYLKTLPVDYLKIDGSFVRDMVEEPIDHAMVEAINQVGHIMGIQTIAEYVHSEAIVERLRVLKVDYAQGYAIGLPMPWDDFGTA